MEKMIGKRIGVIILVGVLGHFSALGQLQVNVGSSLQQLAELLAGDQMQVSNVSFEITNDGEESAYGTYNDQFGLLGLDQGALFTTGAARNALGPNDNKNASQSNSPDFSCSGIDTVSHVEVHEMMAELDAKFDHHSLEVPVYCDHIILEFDAIPFYDEVGFRYVFGSEEYPFGFEFEGKSDVFGLFISGPGIDGIQNMARLDNGDPVAVASVNFNESADQYVVNGDGSTPFDDFYVQYDGHTEPLEARAQVIPCQTYHFKLVIIDISWDQCDSGVFIEPEDREEEEVVITKTYQFPQYPAAIELCNLGYFVFHRQGDGTEEQVYELEITGSATPAIDYNALPTTYTIPEGEDSVFFEVFPIVDNTDEGVETITISVLSPCIEGLVLATETMDLRDFFFYGMPDVTGCLNDVVEVNPVGLQGRDSIQWLQVPPLSCEFCVNPEVEVTMESDTFVAVIFDKETGCNTRDTVVVAEETILADFTWAVPEAYCSSDIRFQSTSVNAVSFNWSFGDNSTSTEEAPFYQYDVAMTRDTVRFPVSLQVVSPSGCESQKDSILSIHEPFYAPNIFTPNKDGVNETLEFLGIQDGQWELQVVNRWGDVVYEDDAYKNDWVAEDMSEGLYFYRLRNPTGEKELKGWVTILR